MGTTKTQEQVSKAPAPTTADQIKPAPELQGGPMRIRRGPALGMAQTAESVAPAGMAGGEGRAQRTTELQRTVGNARVAQWFTGGGGPQARSGIAQPGDRFEQGSEQTADRVVSGERVARISRISADGLAGAVNRQPLEEATKARRQEEQPAAAADSAVQEQQGKEESKPIQTAPPQSQAEKGHPMPSPAAQRWAAGQEVTSAAQAQVEEQKKSVQTMPAVGKEQPLQRQTEEGSTQTSSATVAKPAPVVKVAPSGTAPESTAPAPAGGKPLAVTSFITESAPTIEGEATDDASLSSAEFQAANGTPDTLTAASLITEPAPRTQAGKTAGATVSGAAANVDALLPAGSDPLAPVGNAEVAASAEQDDEAPGSAPPSDQAESAISEFIAGLKGELGAVQAAANQSIESLRLAGQAQFASIRQELTAHIAAVRQFFGLQRADATQETGQRRAELQAGAVAQEHQLQAASGAEVTRARGEVGARQAQIESTGQAQAAKVGTSGEQQQARTQQVFAQQSAEVRQRGTAARGAYGGGEKGQAQGEAAQQVAAKAEDAVQAPVGGLLADLGAAAGQAAQRFLSVAGQAVRGLGARLVPFTQWVSQLNASVAAGLNRAKGALMGGLAQIEAHVLGALRLLEERTIGFLERLADRAVQAVNRFIDDMATRLAATVRRSLDRIGQKAQQLAAAARKNKNLERVRELLNQAGQQVGERLSELISRLSKIGESVNGAFAQQSGELRAGFAASSDAARLDASTAQGAGARRMQDLTSQGLGRIGEGIAQAANALAVGAAALVAKAGERAQEVADRLGEAVGVTGERLGEQVDRTAQDNRSQVIGATESGIAQATERVGADYDRHQGMLGNLSASISQVWNIFKAVFWVVTGIRIPSLMYTLGVLAQILSNQLGGILDPLVDLVDEDEFHEGRDVGDKISMIIGIGEIVVGIISLIAAVTVTGVGGGVGVGSGGTLAIPAAGVVIVVDAALVTNGVIAIFGGIIVMMAASSGGGFRGPRAKDFDSRIDHIYDNHHPDGRNARQRGPDNSLFPRPWKKGDILRCVKNAWKNRRRMGVQKVPGQDTRFKYHGVDPESGLTIEFWYNAISKIVETAYPI